MRATTRKRLLIVATGLLLVVLTGTLTVLLLRHQIRSSVPADAPRIGLSLDRFWLNELGVTTPLFEQAVARAGGHLVEIERTAAGDPVEVERVGSLLATLDGVILGGGGDIDPARYGGDPATTAATMIDPLADQLQLALLEQASARGVPVLGICRGLQLINVFRGGTLRSLASQPELQAKHFLNLEGHQLWLAEGSELATLLSGVEEEPVMSTHRQALDRVGEGLQPVAWADEQRSEVEALSSVGGAWLLGVMWHPERESIDNERHLAPLRALLAEARQRQHRR